MLFKIGPTILVFGMQEIVQLDQKSKLSKLAKNIPLATELQPNLDPWQWKSAQKFTLDNINGTENDPFDWQPPVRFI